MATAKAKAPVKKAAAKPAAAQGWIEEPAPAPTWQTPPPAPQPMAAQPFDERQYAMLLHLSALSVILSIPGFIGPLVMWLIKKDQSAYVDRNGRAALDFQLSLFIIAVGAVLALIVIAVATLGIGVILLIPVIILFVLAYLVVTIVFPIIAAVKASQGVEYGYPLSFRMLRRPGAVATPR